MTIEQFWQTVIAVFMGNIIYNLFLAVVWGNDDDDDDDDPAYAGT